MDRETKVFLCVKSLFNISNDLKDDFEDYSNILLFIADNIARKMEKEMENTKPSIHKDGNIHNLGEGVKSLNEYMDNTPKMEKEKSLDFPIQTPEERMIEEQVDNTIKEVRKELSNSIKEETSNVGC
jgi:hypothetical protein